MLIVYPLVCAMLNAVIVLNKWHLSFDTISSIKHHCIPYIIQSVRYVCVCVFSIEAINCIIKIYCNYRVQFVGRCTMAMHTNNCQKNLKRATSIIIILFGELHGHIPQKFQSNRVENYYKIISHSALSNMQFHFILIRPGKSICYANAILQCGIVEHRTYLVRKTLIQ